ncbi:MAG: HYR domain-containing protein, partial [Acidobacteria bacterium]|nr:HYR domain-containing protein [Acidobacteriota bacterium]
TTPLDFVSPDALFWAGLNFLSPCLAPGSDGIPGSGTPSFILTFDVTSVDGFFEIDTCCIAPANHLTFVECVTTAGINPEFTKGVIAVGEPPPPNQAPEALCQDIEVDADSATCDADVAPETVDGGSSDPENDSLTFTLEPPGPYSLGPNAVLLIVSDGELADTCEALITVIDVTPPVVVCLGDISVPGDQDTCGTVVNFGPPEAVDNCAIDSIWCEPPSGSFFPGGVTVVSCFARDLAGLIGTCTFNLTVPDQQRPVAECPDDISVSTDADTCGAAVAFTIGATDNCPGVSVAATPPSGSVFPLGPTTVAVVATDAAGNTDTCRFTVTVVDGTPPVLSCPGDLQVANDADSCGAVVDFAATAVDHCSATRISYNPAPGTFFALGETEVEAVATDDAGNADTCRFTVTVVDAQPPLVECPGDIVVNNEPDTCGAHVTFEFAATDNCIEVTTVASHPHDYFFLVGVTTVTVTATDGAGNQASCTFTVTVENPFPPFCEINEPPVCGENPDTTLLWPDDLIDFQLDASNADDDTLIFTLVSVVPPLGTATLTPDGLFSLTGLDSTDEAIIAVTFRVKDRRDSVDCSFNIEHLYFHSEGGVGDPIIVDPGETDGGCNCDCHGDPRCDGMSNVFDVVLAVEVAALLAGEADEELAARRVQVVALAGHDDRPEFHRHTGQLRCEGHPVGPDARAIPVRVAGLEKDPGQRSVDQHRVVESLAG